MNAAAETYAVGDAVPDAVAELIPRLLGQGHVRISVHNITRVSFDQVPGDEQHFLKGKTSSEFWTKSGFMWSNERHVVSVNYFTNEPPVVVPLAPKEES